MPIERQEKDLILLEFDGIPLGRERRYENDHQK